MLSYRFRLLALATAALAVLIVACSGGGSPANVAPTNTPDATSTPIPAGFLPIPTRTPWPTDDPGALDGPRGKCPPAPKEACPQSGETSNVYQDAAMNQVISLKAQLASHRCSHSHAGRNVDPYPCGLPAYPNANALADG